jgi:hypothetical protein
MAKYPLEVHAYREVPLRFGEPPDVVAAPTRRVVDQDVEAAKCIDGRCNDGGRAIPRRRPGVGHRGSASCGDLGDDAGRIGALARAEIIDDHLRALRREQQRVLAADATARASHDRNLAF